MFQGIKLNRLPPFKGINHHLLTLIMLIIFKSGFSQMSGTFTIGGANPDFTNFTEAIDSLYVNGISGNVVFNIRPGTYAGFNIGFIQNVGTYDTIRFQAENLDSASVTITGSVSLLTTSNLTFRSLTIQPDYGQQSTCILIDKSDKIIFQNCRIRRIDNMNFNSDHALIFIKYPWEGSVKTIKFISSVISSEKYTIRYSGTKGTIDYEHDSISGTIWDQFNIASKNYKYNTIICEDCYLESTGQYFEGNKIYLTNNCNALDLIGDFKQNEFFCPVNIGCTILHTNIFHENVNILYSNNLIMADNVVEKDILIAYCHNSKICFNKFFGDVIFGSDNQKVISNFFSGNVIFPQGPDQQIYYNNFGPSSRLEVYWCSASIKNNIIFSDTVAQPSVTMMVNNNFGPCPLCLRTMTGSDASFYDPMYVSDNDLHATNPILIQKALEITGILYDFDIDSVLRSPAASLSANEICFNFPIDTVEQRCNDFLCLNVCLDDFTGYYWSPSSLFPDSTVNAPVIHLANSGYVFLNEIGTGKVDSLFIEVIPSVPFANQSYLADQFSVEYTNLSWCAENVLWDFGDGNYSTDWNPVHIFPHSGIFQCKLIAFNSLGTDTCRFTTNILITSLSVQSESSLSISPNPASSEELVIKANFPQTEYKLTVYNISGIQVFETILKNGISRLDVSHYNSGVYLFLIETENQNIFRKVLIR